MNHIGEADRWIGLIDSLVPEILSLVVSTWDTMPHPANDALEDPITEELCRNLRRHKNSRDLPFQIRVQETELDPAPGEDQGRMDIVFSPMTNREDIYFCLECKRLNVPYKGEIRPYSSEYIAHGMMRFVRGQYADRVLQGGMLGYVMDGHPCKAINNINNLLGKHSEELGMSKVSQFDGSRILPSEPRLKETVHLRKSGSEEFVLHHFFASRRQ